MHAILVWDLPNRVVHWFFASSLAMAMVIGFLADGDHSLFRLHRLFGILALFMLAIRLVLGVAVSRYSRFASFPLQPQEILSYIAA